MLAFTERDFRAVKPCKHETDSARGSLPTVPPAVKPPPASATAATLNFVPSFMPLSLLQPSLPSAS